MRESGIRMRYRYSSMRLSWLSMKRCYYFIMWHEVVRRYRAYGTRAEFWYRTAASLAVFVGSFIVNEYAIQFATGHASNGVTDLILSNTPTFNVDALFVYGTFLVAGLTVAIVLAHPRRIPFVLNGLALFLLIRSGFTSLTHLGPFEPYTSDFGTTITNAFFGDDYFFSGHTGMPFLGALAFWKERPIRYFYLVCSAGFAAIVLLGHLHYSIDVFAAFFITYAIYDLAQWLFRKDYAIFQSDL
jgi:hypothetical protein